MNLILATDSYKCSHFKQYPPGCQTVYSYFESRGGAWDEVCFFGLQYYLLKYLEGQVVCREHVAEAKEFCAAHFGNDTLFNLAGWKLLVERHAGRLPVTIKAAPEGTVVPTRNVLMTIENTDPDFFWLPNYLETLLVQVWYGSTVATQSREMKKVILRYLAETGDPGLIDFKLHDFGFRGVSSYESAAVGGAAHLVNFKGTDTMAGPVLARDYYQCPMAGFSIPASEHSTITSWGRDGERDAMRNMLEQYPTGLVACVSDSFDIYRACSEYWGRDLRDMVLARDGVLVVRPDSGHPPEVVPRVLGALGDAFGSENNMKGYKLLHPKVRVIQGDGIDYAMMGMVLEATKRAGWSIDNIAFGSGGGLLQKLNRDTLKFAFKCSEVTVNGERRDVWKDPTTDGGKVSKRGRLALVRRNGKLETVRDQFGMEPNNQLCEVFRDGSCLVRWSLDSIRERAKVS